MDTDQAYNDKAEEFTRSYESLSFEAVHEQVLDFMPQTGAVVLDIGSGSGRDAAWFARRGCDVVAIDPSPKMLELAANLHPEPQIRWIQDKLPGLEKTMRLGLSFDLILLSAVWMHIPIADRPRAFRKMVSLLKAGGKMVISLRHGPLDAGRQVYPVSLEEIQHLALQHGIAVKAVHKSPDRLGRTDVQWETICLQLPDDGTEALPLLRHTILNDSKSSTYKLGLLRVLIRIADSAVGMIKDSGDDYVSIPLGLVALYWIRMYKPLIEMGIQQMPPNKSDKGPSFVKEPFHRLSEVSSYDLRVGARFAERQGLWLRDALVDARNTIKNMPAYFITYPNSNEQIFKPVLSGRLPQSTSFILDEQFLSSYGELQVPRHLWRAMSRFAAWIEPSLLTEWMRLMQSYTAARGQEASMDELMKALVWLEPERDTRQVALIAQRFFQEDKPVYCVWSGKRLQPNTCDIDHCFPFSAWPCGDLWNLMPSQRALNQRQKGDKLVSASILHYAKYRMLEWWQNAYVESGNDYLQERFVNEANATLPVDVSQKNSNSMESIFGGVLLKRVALKQNLQLPDWEFVP